LQFGSAGLGLNSFVHFSVSTGKALWSQEALGVHSFCICCAILSQVTDLLSFWALSVGWASKSGRMSKSQDSSCRIWASCLSYAS
jgi:hypothetical protein